MNWFIEFHDLFYIEFLEFSLPVKEALLAKSKLLKTYGPSLGRPHVDTLFDSKHSNMKELRITVNNEIWRIAFAFDPNRKGIILCGADKKGKNQNRFYKNLIKTADTRFSQHLDQLRESK